MFCELMPKERRRKQRLRREFLQAHTKLCHIIFQQNKWVSLGKRNRRNGKERIAIYTLLHLNSKTGTSFPQAGNEIEYNCQYHHSNRYEEYPSRPQGLV